MILELPGFDHSDLSEVQKLRIQVPVTQGDRWRRGLFRLFIFLTAWPTEQPWLVGDGGPLAV